MRVELAKFTPKTNGENECLFLLASTTTFTGVMGGSGPPTNTKSDDIRKKRDEVTWIQILAGMGLPRS